MLINAKFMTFQQHNDSMLDKYQVTFDYFVYIISHLHVFLHKKATTERFQLVCVSDLHENPSLH